jgi:hypothetical protein
MNLPFTLPDWLPAWAFLLLAIPALLFVLAFLLMPFSVFGVKARLEAVEAQLDAIAEELRNLNFRARGVAGSSFTDDGETFDLPNFGRQRAQRPATEDSRTAPPIPPTPVAAPPALPPIVASRIDMQRDKPAAPRLPQRPGRREPRLD